MWWCKKYRKSKKETKVNDPFSAFTPDKAKYLKDNDYHVIDWETMQELVGKHPLSFDKLMFGEKDWRFYKRYHGDIFLYSAEYLNDSTFGKLKKGSVKMSSLYLKGVEDNEHSHTTSDM